MFMRGFSCYRSPHSRPTAWLARRISRICASVLVRDRSAPCGTYSILPPALQIPLSALHYARARAGPPATTIVDILAAAVARRSQTFFDFQVQDGRKRCGESASSFVGDTSSESPLFNRSASSKLEISSFCSASGRLPPTLTSRRDSGTSLCARY